MAASTQVELVRSFANTLDVEDGTDRLADAAGLEGWLAERDLPGAGAPVTAGDLDLARRLRDALRRELLAHHDGGPDPEARGALDVVAAELPLRLRVPADGLPVLAGAGTGPRAGLAEVLAAAAGAAAEGAWDRLKLCPADDCAWAFYDESRNRSRRWCSMDVCGNRTKTRSYRARRRA